MNYLINGQPLTDWIIEKGTMFRPPVTVESNMLQIPGQHGAVNAARFPIFAEPTLTLHLATKRGVDIESAYIGLLAALMQPSLTVGREVNGVQQTATARLISMTEADRGQGFARYTVILDLPDVFWYAAAETSPSAVVPNTGWQPSLFRGSTAPNLNTVIQVSGPITAIHVKDSPTGTGISWAGAGMVAGQYLYLDVATLKAWRTTGASQWTPGGTDVTSGVDYPPEGPLQVWPIPNTTYGTVALLTIEASGASSATQIRLRTKPAYI